MATIRKLKSGKWQVQIRLAGHKPVAASFSTKSKAMAFATTTESEMRKGAEAPLLPKDVRKLRGITLGELVEKWVADKKLVSYAAAVNSLLNDPIAKLPVLDITKEMVLQWKARKLKTIQSSSVAKYVRVPRGAWEYGLDVMSLPLGKNPFLKIGIKDSKKRRYRRLNDGEEQRLIAGMTALSGDARKLLPLVFTLALETAMRRGEIMRVRPEHLRRDGKYLWIPETKTGTPRLIPLTEKARGLLTDLGPVGHGQTFFHPAKAKDITRWFTRLCREVGIKDLHFHDLRHEALSRLNDKGLSPFALKKISGHKTVENLDIYIQPDLDQIATQMGC